MYKIAGPNKYRPSIHCYIFRSPPHGLVINQTLIRAHLGDEQLHAPAVKEGHLCPQEDPKVLGSVETHLLVRGREDLAEDDLRGNLVGKVKRRQY